MAVCGSMLWWLFVAPCVHGCLWLHAFVAWMMMILTMMVIMLIIMMMMMIIMCTAALSRCSRGAGFGARPRVALLRLR